MDLRVNIHVLGIERHNKRAQSKKIRDPKEEIKEQEETNVVKSEDKWIWFGFYENNMFSLLAVEICFWVLNHKLYFRRDAWKTIFVTVSNDKFSNFWPFVTSDDMFHPNFIGAHVLGFWLLCRHDHVRKLPVLCVRLDNGRLYGFWRYDFKYDFKICFHIILSVYIFLVICRFQFWWHFQVLTLFSDDLVFYWSYSVMSRSIFCWCYMIFSHVIVFWVLTYFQISDHVSVFVFCYV